jgi:hypothetical protein
VTYVRLDAAECGIHRAALNEWLKQFVLLRRRRYASQVPGPYAAAHPEGRLWLMSETADIRPVVYDYTPTRERAGPEQFLKPYRTFLRADDYAAHDSFSPIRRHRPVDVGRWADADRHADLLKTPAYPLTTCRPQPFRRSQFGHDDGWHRRAKQAVRP